MLTMLDPQYYISVVAKGAALLDEKYPGWERKIDLSTLDLSEGCHCIAGQVHPAHFLGFVNDERWTWGEASEYGFNTRYPKHVEAETDEAFRAYNDKCYSALQECWVTLIKGRFNSGYLSDDA